MVNPVRKFSTFQRDGSHGALDPMSVRLEAEFAEKGIVSSYPLQAVGLSNGVKAISRSRDRILWTEEGSKAKPITIKWNLLFLFTLLALFLIGGSLFYVWSRIQVIQLGYGISNALKKERGLTEDNKKLRLEIATLKSYARIEKIAVEELRMAKPRPDQVIVIR